LWGVVCSEKLTAGMQRRYSPRDMQHEIVAQLRVRNVSLICIDEAQMIDARNLDLLRQIPDIARESGHPLGMILAGTAVLRQSLVTIGQLGQRFSAEIRLQPLTEGQFRDHWSDFHPHLGELKDSLTRVEWRDLTEQIHRKTRGNLRRLERVLINANELALVFGRPIDREILDFATDKLADEE
jgi:type II secretory pathway predicted ATPase ExeA